MIGSRVRVPFYSPRLPGAGGGGGGVFQPQGGTPWKPSPIGGAVGGLGKIFGDYLQGRFINRGRQMEEELLPLQKDVLRARAEYDRQPRYASGKERTAAVVSKEIDGLLKSLDILRDSTSYKKGSPHEQLLIKLLYDRRDEMLELQGMKVEETVIPGTPAKKPLWGFNTPAVPETSTFELVPKSSPFGITPLPGAEPRATPTPLPPTSTQTPTPSLLDTSERPRRKVESKEVSPVTPGLAAIAKSKFEPKGETDVISELMRRPKEEPQKAGTPEQTFDKYPEPKTVKEFNDTISHIPSKEMKKLYFEKMIERIKDNELAAQIYKIWIDELYE